MRIVLLMHVVIRQTMYVILAPIHVKVGDHKKTKGCMCCMLEKSRNENINVYANFISGNLFTH